MTTFEFLAVSFWNPGKSDLFPSTTGKSHFVLKLNARQKKIIFQCLHGSQICKRKPWIYVVYPWNLSGCIIFVPITKRKKGKQPVPARLHLFGMVRRGKVLKYYNNLESFMNFIYFISRSSFFCFSPAVLLPFFICQALMVNRAFSQTHT